MTDVKNTDDWKQALATAISDPEILLSYLELNHHPERVFAARRAARLFPLKVPWSYVRRMEKGNPNDPLLLQVLPLGEECIPALDGFRADPVGDQAAMVIPGLLHKYQGRVLLITTGACAIHCRYCFRRSFPYPEAQTGDQWQAALDYIAAQTDIEEVILSGGDPLVLSDRRLAEFHTKLVAIPHLKRLRIHTRLPIVLPQRINKPLLDWVSHSPLKIVIVIHSNHANEINDEVRTSLSTLKNAGAILFNQAVLLRNINDTIEAQINLSKALFEAGVIPYYLHILDKAQGTAHFDNSLSVATALYDKMKHALPGYLVPTLVREDEGQPAKTRINSIDSLDSQQKMSKVANSTIFCHAQNLPDKRGPN